MLYVDYNEGKELQPFFSGGTGTFTVDFTDFNFQAG